MRERVRVEGRERDREGWKERGRRVRVREADAETSIRRAVPRSLLISEC